MSMSIADAAGYVTLQDIDALAFVCRTCRNAAIIETGKRWTGLSFGKSWMLVASLGDPTFQHCDANVPFV
jgi:hypothetical protein